MKNIFLYILMCTSMLASAQSGITWSPSGGSDIGTAVYDNQHPRMAIDAAGNPLVIWGRASDMSCFFSRWDGTTFTAPVKLNPTWLHVDNASWHGPDIAAKGDTVYVVMRHAMADSNYIFLVKSFDGGINFSQPIRVDYIADSSAYYPAVTTDDLGNPLVSFMKYDPSGAYSSARWVVSKSTDFGNTFLPDVKASYYRGAGDEVCDCCPSAILATGNTTAVLYRDNYSNIRDIWTGLSTNAGASFTSAFAADTNHWNYPSCPSSGPDAIIIGDTIYSVFLSGGSGSFRVYFSKSSISTGIMASITPLTGNITGLTQQNFPRIERYGNAVGIVWKQNVAAQPQLPILFTNNIANGFPAAYDTVDLVNITNTDIAVFNGKVYSVWQDDNANTVKFRSGTFIPYSYTAISEVEKNSLLVLPNPAKDFITVQSDDFKFINAQYEIYSIGGILICKGILNNSKNEINIQYFANGLYSIVIRNDKESISKTFSKF